MLRSVELTGFRLPEQRDKLKKSQLYERPLFQIKTAFLGCKIKLKHSQENRRFLATYSATGCVPTPCTCARKE
jgi:hypothetical protein